MSEQNPSRSEIVRRAALRREGEHYKAAGMLDRVALVNDELRRLGEDTIHVDAPKPPRQTRTSTQAATRQKRTAD